MTYCKCCTSPAVVIDPLTGAAYCGHHASENIDANAVADVAESYWPGDTHLDDPFFDPPAEPR